MNLHILFNPAQADGSTLPTASLALTLSEEVQARCAGFVQAEIERYAEELQDSAESDQDLSDGQDSDNEEGAESAKPRKANNKKKGKLSSRIEPTGKLTRRNHKAMFAVANVMNRSYISCAPGARIHLHGRDRDLPARNPRGRDTLSALRRAPNPLRSPWCVFRPVCEGHRGHTPRGRHVQEQRRCSRGRHV